MPGLEVTCRVLHAIVHLMEVVLSVLRTGYFWWLCYCCLRWSALPVCGSCELVAAVLSLSRASSACCVRHGQHIMAAAAAVACVHACVGWPWSLQYSQCSAC
jgi:hypothetical protein